MGWSFGHATDPDDQLDFGATRKVLRRTARMLRPYRRDALGAAGFLVVWTAMLLAGPLLVRRAIDQGLDKNDAEFIHHTLEALWMYQWNNTVNEPLLRRLLKSTDFRARAAATRVLCDWRNRVSEPLALVKTLVNDKHPRVRLEAVRACSFFTTAKAGEIALEATQHDMDKYLDYTLKETLKTLRRFN